MMEIRQASAPAAARTNKSSREPHTSRTSKVFRAEQLSSQQHNSGNRERNKESRSDHRYSSGKPHSGSRNTSGNNNTASRQAERSNMTLEGTREVCERAQTGEGQAAQRREELGKDDIHVEKERKREKKDRKEKGTSKHFSNSSSAHRTCPHNERGPHEGSANDEKRQRREERSCVVAECPGGAAAIGNSTQSRKDGHSSKERKDGKGSATSKTNGPFLDTDGGGALPDRNSSNAPAAVETEGGMSGAPPRSPSVQEKPQQHHGRSKPHKSQRERHNEQESTDRMKVETHGQSSRDKRHVKEGKGEGATAVSHQKVNGAALAPVTPSDIATDDVRKIAEDRCEVKSGESARERKGERHGEKRKDTDVESGRAEKKRRRATEEQHKGQGATAPDPKKPDMTNGVKAEGKNVGVEDKTNKYRDRKHKRPKRPPSPPGQPSVLPTSASTGVKTTLVTPQPKEGSSSSRRQPHCSTSSTHIRRESPLQREGPTSSSSSVVCSSVKELHDHNSNTTVAPCHNTISIKCRQEEREGDRKEKKKRNHRQRTDFVERESGSSKKQGEDCNACAPEQITIAATPEASGASLKELPMNAVGQREHNGSSKGYKGSSSNKQDKPEVRLEERTQKMSTGMCSGEGGRVLLVDTEKSGKAKKESKRGADEGDHKSRVSNNDTSVCRGSGSGRPSKDKKSRKEGDIRHGKHTRRPSRERSKTKSEKTQSNSSSFSAKEPVPVVAADVDEPVKCAQPQVKELRTVHCEEQQKQQQPSGRSDESRLAGEDVHMQQKQRQEEHRQVEPRRKDAHHNRGQEKEGVKGGSSVPNLKKSKTTGHIHNLHRTADREKPRKADGERRQSPLQQLAPADDIKLPLQHQQKQRLAEGPKDVKKASAATSTEKEVNVEGKEHQRPHSLLNTHNGNAETLEHRGLPSTAPRSHTSGHVNDRAEGAGKNSAAKLLRKEAVDKSPPSSCNSSLSISSSRHISGVVEVKQVSEDCKQQARSSSGPSARKGDTRESPRRSKHVRRDEGHGGQSVSSTQPLGHSGESGRQDDTCNGDKLRRTKKSKKQPKTENSSNRTSVKQEEKEEELCISADVDNDSADVAASNSGQQISSLSHAAGGAMETSTSAEEAANITAPPAVTAALVEAECRCRSAKRSNCRSGGSSNVKARREKNHHRASGVRRSHSRSARSRTSSWSSRSTSRSCSSRSRSSSCSRRRSNSSKRKDGRRNRRGSHQRRARSRESNKSNDASSTNRSSVRRGSSISTGRSRTSSGRRSRRSSRSTSTSSRTSGNGKSGSGRSDKRSRSRSSSRSRSRSRSSSRSRRSCSGSRSSRSSRSASRSSRSGSRSSRSASRSSQSASRSSRSTSRDSSGSSGRGSSSSTRRSSNSSRSSSSGSSRSDSRSSRSSTSRSRSTDERSESGRGSDSGRSGSRSSSRRSNGSSRKGRRRRRSRSSSSSPSLLAILNTADPTRNSQGDPFPPDLQGPCYLKILPRARDPPVILGIDNRGLIRLAKQHGCKLKLSAVDDVFPNTDRRLLLIYGGATANCVHALQEWVQKTAVKKPQQPTDKSHMQKTAATNSSGAERSNARQSQQAGALQRQQEQQGGGSQTKLQQQRGRQLQRSQPQDEDAELEAELTFVVAHIAIRHMRVSPWSSLDLTKQPAAATTAAKPTTTAGSGDPSSTATPAASGGTSAAATSGEALIPASGSAQQSAASGAVAADAAVKREEQLQGSAQMSQQQSARHIEQQQERNDQVQGPDCEGEKKPVCSPEQQEKAVPQHQVHRERPSQQQVLESVQQSHEQQETCADVDGQQQAGGIIATVKQQQDEVTGSGKATDSKNCDGSLTAAGAAAAFSLMQSRTAGIPAPPSTSTSPSTAPVSSPPVSAVGGGPHSGSNLQQQEEPAVRQQHQAVPSEQQHTASLAQSSLGIQPPQQQGNAFSSSENGVLSSPGPCVAGVPPQPPPPPPPFNGSTQHAPVEPTQEQFQLQQEQEKQQEQARLLRQRSAWPPGTLLYGLRTLEGAHLKLSRRQHMRWGCRERLLTLRGSLQDVQRALACVAFSLQHFLHQRDYMNVKYVRYTEERRRRRRSPSPLPTVPRIVLQEPALPSALVPGLQFQRVLQGLNVQDELVRMTNLRGIIDHHVVEMRGPAYVKVVISDLVTTLLLGTVKSEMENKSCPLRVIEKTCGVQAKVMDPEMPGILERVLVISGQPASVDKATMAVLEKVYAACIMAGQASQVTWRMCASNSAASLIIGTGGHRVKQLRHITNTRIQINTRDNVPVVDRWERVVTITGTYAAVAAAARAMLPFMHADPNHGQHVHQCYGTGTRHEMPEWAEQAVQREGMDEEAGRRPPLPDDRDVSFTGPCFLKLLIDNALANALIGKEAQTIIALSEATQCVMKFAPATTVFPGCPGERVLGLSGSAEAINNAAIAIIEKCKEVHPNLSYDQMYGKVIVPHTCCSSIIGAGGSRIREIREATLTRIAISKKGIHTPERLVCIYGMPQGVHTALVTIFGIIQCDPGIRVMLDVVYPPELEGDQKKKEADRLSVGLIGAVLEGVQAVVNKVGVDETAEAALKKLQELQRAAAIAAGELPPDAEDGEIRGPLGPMGQTRGAAQHTNYSTPISFIPASSYLPSTAASETSVAMLQDDGSSVGGMRALPGQHIQALAYGVPGASRDAAAAAELGFVSTWAGTADGASSSNRLLQLQAAEGSAPLGISRTASIYAGATGGQLFDGERASRNAAEATVAVAGGSFGDPLQATSQQGLWGTESSGRQHQQLTRQEKRQRLLEASLNRSFGAAAREERQLTAAGEHIRGGEGDEEQHDEDEDLSLAGLMDEKF